MLDEEVVENIQCILRRAGLWIDNEMTIALPPVANDVECDEETGSCTIVQDFGVYADNGWRLLATGTAVTRYYVSEDGNHVDVAETYIVMPREEVVKLYNYVKSRKVLRAKEG